MLSYSVQVWTRFNWIREFQLKAKRMQGIQRMTTDMPEMKLGIQYYPLLFEFPNNEIKEEYLQWANNRNLEIAKNID